MEIGYVGLGNMGGALAERLLLKRKQRVFDLKPAAMQRLAAKGATPVQSLKGLAAESDLVLTCLPTSNEVRAAIYGPDGLAAGMKKGGIIADMTTGDPAETRAMANDLATKGITLIDAPVSGGPHGAHAGTIAIMVGASEEVYRKIKPVLDDMTCNVFHCGDVGSGQVMKLVNNMVAAGVRALTFEAVTMGVKNGLTLAKCTEVLAKSSGRSYSTEITLPRLVSGQILANFTLALMHKDVRLATELGMQSGSPMPLAGLVREIFQTAMNAEGPDGDVNMLIRLNERNANVKVVG